MHVRAASSRHHCIHRRLPRLCGAGTLADPTNSYNPTPPFPTISIHSLIRLILLALLSQAILVTEGGRALGRELGLE
jgi:hypothetical protein